MEIGGYFNFELRKNGSFPHDNGILLNSGRNALEVISVYKNGKFNNQLVLSLLSEEFLDISK